MAKDLINIIYRWVKSNGQTKYECKEFKVIVSKNRVPNAKNVWMNATFANNSHKDDSLLSMEPHCICPRNYNRQFIHQFSHAFLWTTKPFDGKIPKNVTLITHPIWDGTIPAQNYKSGQLPWGQRKNEIVLVANNKTSARPEQLYTLRIQTMNKLMNKSHNMKLSGYGNKGFKRPWYISPLKNKKQLLNTVKFNLCMENCYHPKFSHNYFTEKMFDALIAGSVPIYMGCYNIDELNLPKTYIDLRKYTSKTDKGYVLSNVKGLVNEIKSFDKKKYIKLQKEVEDSINDPNGLYKLISYEAVFYTMAKALF